MGTIDDPSRLNFVTPLPPLPTEIANHSALVLDALAKRGSAVLAWTDQPHWDDTPDYPVRRFAAHNVPVAALSTARASFYNIGNNIRFHAGIWEASRRAPGIVILHDTGLQHFFQGFAITPNGRSDYIAMMGRFYGPAGQAAAIARVQRGEGDILDMARCYPMTEGVLDGSLGAVVHNEDELGKLRRMTRGPVWYVPLAGPAAAPARAARRSSSRRLRLIVFGHIGPNRRVVEIIRALGTSSVRQRYRLDVFGAIEEPGAVTAEIAAQGLGTQVSLHGFVPMPALEAALTQADLALNLRYPTVGEASSSQLRVWANALPSLVTQVGWYAGLPPETVNFVRPDHEAADLQQHLAAFAKDPAPYVRSGLAGRQRLDALHGADAYAAAMLDIAAEVERPRPVAMALLPDPPDDAPPAVEGHVDTASDSQITGWARSCTDTVQPVLVRAFVDDRLVAETQADAFREDLHRIVPGRGYCGFTLRVGPGHGGKLTVMAETGDGRAVLLQDSRARVARGAAPGRPAAPRVHLDVTDLLAYSLTTKTVSGIQRVQLGLIANWLCVPDRHGRIRFAVFCVETQRFHAVDMRDMAWLIDSLSREAHSDDRPVRIRAMLSAAAQSDPLRPRPADTLLVTGNFWSFPGFHAALRQMQIDTGVHYVQFLYDAVPSIVPETCPFETAVDYNRTLAPMLHQADAICAISHHTAGELRMLAGRLGLPCPPIAVVPLGTQAHYGEDTHAEAELPPDLGDFVLCVGTIEPRKNHLYLFHVWRRLLSRTGQLTPKLVCAGRFGWFTEDLKRHLHATSNLDGHIVTLAGISDVQLRALYRRCRFTIYPSIYEGWGLPVSESQSEGRLCVTSNVSAMPEAGGKWARYLDPFDVSSGFETVCDLLDHPEQVRAAEAAIRDTYRPTSWAEAADAVWDTVARQVEAAAIVQRQLYRPPVLGMGEQHQLLPPVPATGLLAIARTELAASAFRHVLFGPDWNAVEHWGVWARGTVARLTFQTEIIEEEVIAYLRVGLPDDSGSNWCRMTVNGADVASADLMPGLQTIRVPLGRGGAVRVDITLAHDVAVAGDLRRLGLGLHRLFVCRISDVAARLAFLEDQR